MVTDGGAERAEQAAAAVLLLAAFTFQVRLLVPVVGLVLAADALAGSRGPVPWLWARITDRWPRLSRPGDPDRARAQAALVTVVAAAATVLFTIGLGGLGWLVTLAGAAAATLAATGVVFLGPVLTRRLRG